MNFLKKSLASLMVVIMMLTSIPLQGFVDFELPQWFSFDAQAADVEPVVSEEVSLSGTEMVSADVEETETEDNKSFFDRFINSGALKSDAEDFLEVLQNSSISDLISPKREPMMFSMAPASVEEELAEEQPTSGTINETVFWEYDTETKTLTVSGEGDIPGYIPGVIFDRMTEEEKVEYPYETAPWDAYLMEMKKLIIGEGITNIGDFNFAICVNLENVEFNDGLISIGNYCFVYCLVIKSITFPSTLVSMGEECFDYCLSLEELYFNDGFKTLGKYCFDSILSLEKAYFPESFETENFSLRISGAGEVTINSSVNFIIDVNKCFDEHSFEAYKLYNKVYYKYALGLDNNFVPPEELDENEFIRLYISEYNEKFDTSYDPENEEDLKIIEEIFAALGFQYFADENLIFNLSESSPVHETCKRMYIKHFVGDSTEECNCFVFEGKVCDTIDWSIDVDTKTLTLSGSGSYPVENDFDIRSYMYANNYIENVVYAEDSTMDAIGGYDFDGMDILSITIPANIELIRNNAFQNCRKLTNVIIEGEGRKGGTIWPNAFKNCYSLKSIDIPENFGWLSEGAFAGSSLERITIRDPYCTIGGEAGDPATIPESTVIYGYKDSTAEAFAIKNNRTFKSIDEFTVGDLEYSIGKISGYDGEVVTITGYKGKAETVTIPDKIEDLDVVAIGNRAFYANKYIKNVIIPDSVEKIGNTVFASSTLTTITFGKGIKRIDYSAFNSCKSLTTVYAVDFETWNSISFEGSYANPLYYADDFYFGEELIEDLVIPEDVTEIAAYAFCGYKGFESVSIPEGVTSIGDYAFAETNLTKIHIPSTVTTMYRAFSKATLLTTVTLAEGIKSISGSAFFYCTSLESITIPDSVTTIDSYAFEDCIALETVHIGSGIKNIYSAAFYGCEKLKDIYIDDISDWLKIYFSGTQSNPLYYAENLYVNGALLEELNVPETVTAIKDYAFYKYAKLSKVTLPQGITKLGDHAFYKSSVKEIFIPKTVTSIYRPFGENEVLEKVVFEEGISKITSYAFESCKALTSVVIPEGVTEIATEAFDNCVKLQNVVLPQSLVTIGNYAFYGCDSITEIVIPDAVTNIGSYAFCSCDKLENVTIGKNVKTVNDGAFYSGNINNVYAYDIASWAEINFSTATANPMHYGENLYLGGKLIGEEIVIPEGVTKTGKYAFAGFDNLTSVTLSNTVTSVGNSSFYGCENLEKVILSDSLTSIGSSAFYGCKKLNNLNLGNELKKINSCAFENCTSLIELVIPDSVTNIGDAVFRGCTSIESVDIGENTKAIGYYAFEGCENIKEVYVNSLSVWFGILYYSRTANPLSYGAKLYVGGQEVSDIVIPDDITNVKSYAFLNTDITSLYVGKNVKTINNYAFDNCDKLKTVTLENGITYLGDYSFRNCISLENIVIPDTVSSVGSYCFQNCTSLKTAVLSNKLNAITNGMFCDCSSLISIEIPNSAYRINSSAFVNCTSLKSAVIGFETTSIASDAFNGCNALTIYGVAGTAAEIYALDNSIPFKTLGDVLTLNVIDTEGNKVEGGFTVYWYNSEENVVGTGIYLGNISFGETYTYKVVLGEELSMVYKVPESGSVTTDIETTSAELVLEKYPLKKVTGTITNKNGDKLLGVSVQIKQFFNEKYEKNTSATTDENGTFSLVVPEKDAIVLYSLDGYYDFKRNLDKYPDGDESVDVSVFLTEMPENRITLRMTMKSSEMVWNEPVVSVVGSTNDLSFGIYDKSLDRNISDYIVQYPYIIIEDENVSSNDVIEITVTDSKKRMTAPVVAITLDENKKAEANIEFIENGKIAIGGVYGVESAVVMIFDSKGKFLSSSVVDASIAEAYTSSVLPAGEYTIVGIEKTNLLRKVATLSSLEEYGLVENTDYVTSKVNVENGIITTVDALDVIDFDETKFKYTIDENTSVSSNYSTVTAGKYVTIRASYEIDPKYNTSGEKIKIILPDGISFVTGSLTLDGKKTTYNASENTVTVNVNKPKGVVRFYIIATQNGEFNINSDLIFDCENSILTQSIGTVNVIVDLMNFTVPEISSSANISVVGTSVPLSTVRLYDYDDCIGETKSNKNGTWKIDVDISNEKIHRFEAEITNDGYSNSVVTDIEYVLYDADCVTLDKVTMYVANSTCVFNYLSPDTRTPTYTYIPSNNEFTFKVELLNGTDKNVKDVYVVTYNAYGDVEYVECTYDVLSGSWIGTKKFSSYDAPVSVSAAYIDNDVILSPNFLKTENESFQDFKYDVKYVTEEKFIYDMISTDKIYQYELTVGKRNLEEYVSEYEDKDYFVSYITDDFVMLTDDKADEIIDTCFDGDDYCEVRVKIVNNSTSNTELYKKSHRDVGYTENTECWLQRLRGMSRDEVLNELNNLRDKLKDYGDYSYNDINQAKAYNDFVKQLQKFDLLPKVRNVALGGAAVGAVADGAGNVFNGTNYINAGRTRNIDEATYEGIRTALNYLDKEHLLDKCMGNSVNRSSTTGCGKTLPKGDPQDVTPNIDPSGYVYEAVPSNRVGGVKVEAYCYDYPVDEFGVQGEEKEEIFWDASEYDQINPLYTDMNGQYAWDVPPGQWLVKYSKDGYYDTDSRNDPAADEDGYLPVPPPQVDVNTAIVSKAAPVVENVNIYEENIQIIFSQYMKPATVNSDTVKVLCNGETVTGTFTAFDAEYNYEETEQFASIYTFTPDSAFEGTVSVTIDDAVNYAGKAMTSKFVTATEAEVKPESISTPEKVTVEYNAETTVAVSVQPAEAGANKTLTVISEMPDRVSVVTEKVTTDANGKANITLKGNLPGNCIINVLLDGTDLSSAFEVEVGNVVAQKVKCEKVTSSIPSGSSVEKGTVITLSTATEGAEIYYTLDGTCPCVVGSESRLLYTGPITVNEDTFIIAYAVKAGCEDSATAGFVYSIDTTCKHRELEFVKEVPAQCTVSGTKAYYRCESCNKKFTDESAATEITDIVIPAVDHSYSSVVTKKSTCTNDGVKTFTCKCGDTYTETIAKLGHKYASSYTVDKKATCSAEGSKSKHCTRDGCTAKTSVTAIAKLAHTEVKVSGKAATCTKTGLTEGKKCTACGVVTVAQQTIKAMGHKYTNACDTTCNTCKATRKITHSYKSTTTKATLTKNGKVVNKCTVCGNVKSTTIVYYPKTIKLSATKYTYNGKAKTPTVTVKDSKGNTLKKDTDYTVKYASGRKNTGKYAVTITFKGKYSGTKTLYFNILPSKTSKISITSATASIKASWKKVTGASGYKVELLNAKGKVVKKVTTTKTSYTFKKLSKVTTYKVRVTAYKTIDKKAVYSSVSTTITTSTAPAKVTLSKVTAGSKQATVAWKTTSGASGYEVQYSTSSKFKSAKTATVKKGSSKKTTIKKLTKGKKYYFKVRAYKTVDGKKIYGAWSAVKSVKVK